MIDKILYKKDIEAYKSNDSKCKNFEFAKFPRDILMSQQKIQWGVFTADMGTYLSTKANKLVPGKPHSDSKGKFIADADEDLVTQFPYKKLMKNLKSETDLKYYGKKLPSELNNVDIISAIRMNEFKDWLKAWNLWIIRVALQNKTHYCTSWCTCFTNQQWFKV